MKLNPEFYLHLTLWSFTFSVLVNPLSADSGSTQSSTINNQQIDFKRYEIKTNVRNNAILLTGAFLGSGEADIAIVSTADNQEPTVHLFSLSANVWKQSVVAPIGDQVWFIDTGNIKGSERLVSFTRQSINVFDPISKTWTPIIKHKSFSYQPKNKPIRQLDFLQDLNGDGRDDCILLSPNKTKIFIQDEKGLFDENLEIPYPVLTKTDDSIGNLIQKIHIADWNADKRMDLIFWDKGFFKIHLQNDDAMFSQQPKIQNCRIAVKSNGSWSHEIADEHENFFKALLGLRKKTTHIALDSILDLNGDGHADLVTHSLEGRSLLKLKTSIDIHLGKPTDDETVFSAFASSSVSPAGKQPREYSTHHFDDLDGDGQLDLIIISVDAGMGDMIEAVTANTIDLDVEFYQMEKGSYPSKPTLKKRVAPKSNWFSRKGPFFPTVLTGDINGDGFSELVVGRSWNELHIYEGIKGTGLFSKEPQSFKVKIPANEKNSQIIDLNRDGKKDILIHHSSSKSPHLINILISK